MPKLEAFKVKIDQLPVEIVEATTVEDASRRVRDLILTRESLQKLDDDEPVEIKRPDGRPWGRNLTLGLFRERPVTSVAGEDDGPVEAPSR